MSRKPDDFAEYRLVEYAHLPYDDPRFYEARQEDPVPLENRGIPTASAEPLPEALAVAVSETSGEVAGEEGSGQAEGGPETGEKKSSRGKRLAGLGSLGAALLGVALKFKTLLVLALDIKWVAFLGKFGLASISALISVAVYAHLFGWGFAFGLVALLFIHEMGHAAVMKLK